MARPDFVQVVVTIQIQIERPSSVLRCLSMAIYVGAVNVGSLAIVHYQSCAFLEQKKHARAGSTLVRMSGALAFSARIQNLAAN
jgi:hypothetical protein